MFNTEFNIILKYFNHQKNTNNVHVGIGDDAALVSVPKDYQLAITTDTMVSNVHFFPNISPKNLAYKLIVISFSDIAAMGAQPIWLSLALTIPNINHNWLKKFSISLFQQLNFYKVQLIGGDITRGPLSITTTTHGLVPKERYITRFGISDGDLIYVLGTLGDSAAGLAILQSKLYINNIKDRNWLINAHLRPKIWISQGIELRNIASSMIDISDGLISAMENILKINNCGAKIKLNHLPISKVLQNQCSKEQALAFALSGGEEYSLCFTVPKKKYYLLKENFLKKNKKYCFCIGNINTNKRGIKYIDKNKEISLSYTGFEHFV